MKPGDEIVLVEYQPAWPALFEEERRRILDACGSHIGRIEHIGSTAVPGLDAKPIIDLMASSRTIPLGQSAIRSLAALGYRDLGEHGIPGRHFLQKGEPRSHHLHVVLATGSFWKRHLRFRDYLRQHADEAQAYGRLKRELADRFRTDRVAYTQAKAAYIEEVLRKATVVPNEDHLRHR